MRVRSLAQVNDGTERRGIIDVHVRGQPLAQAFDGAVILDVVHAAMACALSVLREIGPEWMVVLREIGLGIFPLVTGSARRNEANGDARRKP